MMKILLKLLKLKIWNLLLIRTTKEKAFGKNFQDKYYNVHKLKKN